MKRLFFLLVLSVMISACHDVNQIPKTANANNNQQPTSDCSDNQAVNNSHSLNKIDVLGCPVK